MIKTPIMNSVIEPKISGSDAEDFVDFFCKKLFLQPWVYKSPKCNDGDEFSDVVILFKDTLILFEVKGNKFNPAEPQRYLKEAKDRHRQLVRARNIIQGRRKNVHFKNDFYTSTTDLSEIKNVKLISVSTGPGEMEIAYGKEGIDFSKLDTEEVGKYLGFYDPQTSIHSFTAEELIYATKHIDTIKDFLRYLDFEEKFLNNAFNSTQEQSIIAVVDTHREDLISIFTINYYWDEHLNRTGEVKLDKIFGSADISEADMVMYAGTDTHKSIGEDETYKKMMLERKESYFWDALINHVSSRCEFAYKISGTDNKQQPVEQSELKEILEVMSDTSRFERVEYSKKIIETLKEGHNFRNMMSLADDSSILFSFRNIIYPSFPTEEEQRKQSEGHAYIAWCRVEYGKNFISIKNKIQKVLLITRHSHKEQEAFSFGLTDKLVVSESTCENLGLLW